MDGDLDAFYKLFKGISESIVELEKQINYASSSDVTTESLADIKSIFNMSVDYVLLNDDFLSMFKKAAPRLVDKTNILGTDKCDRLKAFNNEIDRKVKSLRDAVKREEEKAKLEKTRNVHVNTLETFKKAFQPSRDDMQKMASKREELKKGLRDYEKQMIQDMPRFKKVYSQQSSIETEISGFRVNEQLLQNKSKEIDELRKGPSIDWGGLIAAFYN